MANKKQALAFFVLLIGILLFFTAVAVYTYQPSHRNLDGNWDKTVVTVDGEDLTLKDVIFYIAYEESQVEKQAEIYDSNDTNAYWNMHTNGQFIKISAKEATMDMIIHDTIFYKLAVKNKVKLTDEEKREVRLSQYDFWSDLNEDQQAILKPLKKEMLFSIEKRALVQKEQAITAELEGSSNKNYNINGEGYQRMLQSHSFQIHKDIWDSLEFGNLTLKHTSK